MEDKTNGDDGEEVRRGKKDKNYKDSRRTKKRVMSSMLRAENTQDTNIRFLYMIRRSLAQENRPLTVIRK